MFGQGTITPKTQNSSLDYMDPSAITVSEPLKCAVCSSPFDTEERLPILLPFCSHSICKLCDPTSDSNKNGPNSVSCRHCSKQINLPKAKKNLPLNIALRDLLEAGISNFGQCQTHPKSKLEFFCFSETCSHRLPLCAFCLEEKHLECSEDTILKMGNIKKVLSESQVRDIDDWLQNLKSWVQTQLENSKQNLFKFFELFAENLKQKVQAIINLDIEEIDFAKTSIKLQNKSDGSIGFSCQEFDFVKEITADFDRVFVKGNFDHELRGVETMSAVWAARKIFNEPNGGLYDSKLFARLKKIDQFMLRNFYFSDVEMANLNNIQEFKNRIGESFEKGELLTIKRIEIGQNFEAGHMENIEQKIRAELTPMAVSVPDVEYFLSDWLNQDCANPHYKWQVYVWPNGPLEESPDTRNQTGVLKVNDLAITFVKEAHNN